MRVLLLVPPLLAALSLAACEDQPTVDAGPPAAEAPEGEGDPAPASTTLGGVDLDGDVSLIGTEPFWGVQFTSGSVSYSGVDRPELTAVRPAPVIQGTIATWTMTTSDGTDLVVTLAETECSDGMSDRTYPLTAQVVIADETLNGCGASTAWMQSTGEDGEPE
jgi:uncharacterized membrane protein